MKKCFSLSNYYTRMLAGRYTDEVNEQDLEMVKLIIQQFDFVGILEDDGVNKLSRFLNWEVSLALENATKMTLYKKVKQLIREPLNAYRYSTLEKEFLTLNNDFSEVWCQLDKLDMKLYNFVKNEIDPHRI